MAFHLLDLPDELVVSVIEELRIDRQTLQSLARCSKRMQALAEPLLYEYAFLRTSKETRILSQAVYDATRRQRALNRLEIRCHHRRMDNQAFNDLSGLLNRCSHLKELIFESPYCNNGRWRKSAGWNHGMSMLFSKFRPGPPGSLSEKRLSCLTRAELHLNGEGHEFWTLNAESAVLFSHPTIQDLTVSSINILDDAATLLSGHRRSTPLTSLKLDECNITSDGLKAVLSTPKALQHLYIGEDRYSDREHEIRVRSSPCNDLSTRDPDGFFSALGAQKHSLQTLHYYCGQVLSSTYEAKAISGTAFADFRALTALSYGVGQLERFERLLIFERFERLLLSDLTAPPNLETLAVQFAILRPPYFAIENASSSIPKIRCAEIVYARNCDFDSYQQEIEKTGRALRERSAQFRVFVQTDRSYNPPILYGEELQPNLLIYSNDSTDTVYSHHRGNNLPADVSTDSEWADSEWADTDGEEVESDEAEIEEDQ